MKNRQIFLCLYGYLPVWKVVLNGFFNVLLLFLRLDAWYQPRAWTKTKGNEVGRKVREEGDER